MKIGVLILWALALDLALAVAVLELGPVSEGRLERALADLVGGWDGPETLFELACARLARQVRELGEEPARFRSHPRGMLHRLETACDDALRTAATAVELAEALDPELEADERAAQLAEVLLSRAARLAVERQEAAELEPAATVPALVVELGAAGDAAS